MTEKVHCDDHSGVCVRVKNNEKKLSTNCDSIKNAHQRIDGCVSSSQFRWVVGIIVSAFIFSVGYQFKTLSRIDTGVAVLNERIKNIELSIKEKKGGT